MGSLIRVPYYCPEKYIEADKNVPDERELEEVDPILKIDRERIVKVRVGAPVILPGLLGLKPGANSCLDTAGQNQNSDGGGESGDESDAEDNGD